MLTKTTETAIQTLIYLTLKNSADPLSPKYIAEQLDLSPTYLAKIMRLLAKVNILRSHMGAHGGVTLGMDPSAISLLAIVEACQGRLLGDFCEERPDKASCGYYQAMHAAHLSLLNILSGWSLADLVKTPCHGVALPKRRNCRVYMDMAVLQDGARSMEE